MVHASAVDMGRRKGVATMKRALAIGQYTGALVALLLDESKVCRFTIGVDDCLTVRVRIMLSEKYVEAQQTVSLDVLDHSDAIDLANVHAKHLNRMLLGHRGTL